VLVGADAVQPEQFAAIWKPVTWSRPSSDDTQVLKKPVRTANSDWNSSPARNSMSPRPTVRRVATIVSSWSSCSLDMPTGRHSSRRLQLEQATLKGSSRMPCAVLVMRLSG
jgi:hypothetical protein